MTADKWELHHVTHGLPALPFNESSVVIVDTVHCKDGADLSVEITVMNDEVAIDAEISVSRLNDDPALEYRCSSVIDALSPAQAIELGGALIDAGRRAAAYQAGGRE